MADIISRLKLESGEFDSKIKRAGQELMAYSEHCRKTGLEMGYANRDAKEFAKALGNMQTTSATARGKISELSEAFVNLRVMYKNMTDEEKNKQFGKNLAASLDQLKTRIQDAKKDLADVQQELSGSKFGQFGSILDGIGQKMGLNANITELLTSKTALMSAGIGAAGAIIAKATQEWAAYNAELAKQDQITTVTTGLKGSSANDMTDQARALTDTYGVDFREAINAANTLMTQFGQTGEQSMSLIRDGMQGMIQGDGPKLLSMIQQYAPAFRDAGVNASQLVAVIQNSEGGIFTDQNMNAIVMGIKNIRLMTKATSDALAQLGIDGQKMSQQLSDGSLTIFDALKQVATQIQGVNSNSQAAGEVMQQVFGRQGAMAGTKLGEAIATLNTNLEETKRQTGEVGDAYNDLYNANVKLNKAIRDCFEYDGWDQMATGIKSSLVSALASVIEKLATIRQFLTGMSVNDYIKQMGGSDKVNRMIGRLGNGQGNARNIYDRQVGAFEAYINPRKKYLENLDAWRRGNRSDDVKAEVEWGRNKFGIDDRAIRNRVKAAESQLEEYQKKAEQVFSNVNKKSGEINIDLTSGNKGGNKGVKTTTRTAAAPKTEEQQNAARIAELVKQYQDLATAAKTANDAQKAGLTERMAKIQGEITKLQDRNAELKKFADEARHVQYPVGSLPQLNEQLKTLQTEQAKALDAKQWKDYQRQIEQTQYKIDALKGKWEDGLQATFKLNIEQQGNTDINTAKPEDIAVTFKADDSDVQAKLRDIDGITIDDKTMTVTAQTQDAISALQHVDGLTLQPKTAEVTFRADDADVLAKLRDIEGITIDPKTLTVTSQTQEAIAALQRVDGLTIQPKTAEVTFRADDSDVQAKLRDIDGITIDDKTMTVTAQTQDAISALQHVDGLTLQPKTAEVTFRADDADVLAKLRDIEGITIDPKTLTVTSQTQEAIAALQRVDGLTLQPKTAEVTFKADESDVLSKVRDIDGITIDDKTMTVTAQTQEAIAALQRVDGLTLQPKTAEVTFKADDSNVLAKVRDIDGVTIDPKTMTVTANTADAYNQVQQLLKSVDGKTVTFTVQPKMEMGTSIQNDAGMSSYIASLKQQLETADYGTSLYNGLSAQLADMTTLQNLVGESLKAGLGTAMFDVADETGADFWTRAMEGGVDNIDWQAIVDKINEARKAAGLDAISLDFASGSVSTKDKSEKDGLQVSKTILNAISQLTSGLQSIGIEIPSEIQSVISVMQGVMQVIEAVNTIIGVTQTSALTANTIAMGALTSALWANTTASFIPFANGGIVPKFADGGLIGRAAGGMLIPGNSFSGDNLRMPVVGGGMIGVNSGEVILNQAQAGVIANALEGGGMQNLNLTATISGENIRLALNNNGRRTGRGEYVTTRFK